MFYFGLLGLLEAEVREAEIHFFVLLGLMFLIIFLLKLLSTIFCSFFKIEICIN